MKDEETCLDSKTPKKKIGDIETRNEREKTCLEYDRR
jgi:hypothetical protein